MSEEEAGFEPTMVLRYVVQRSQPPHFYQEPHILQQKWTNGRGEEV